ncbi:methionyl-tRNA formyltransferase [candidate division WOR-3 bacterium]|nr:methionyl-tRNA formyltransferase [candidate division WOR-3 bacterium]
MNIVFFGSDNFGIPTLDKLKDISNLLIITEPDKHMGRGRSLKPLPTKSYAIKNNLKHIETENCNNREILDKIRSFNPDFIVVVSFGQMLNQELLDLPKYMTLNTHPSLLPGYRGAAPIQRAILNGETEIGVSIIKIAMKLDSGDIVSQRKIPLSDNDIYTEIYEKLAELGASLLIESINMIVQGNYTIQSQNNNLSSYASKIKKVDYILKLNKGAYQVQRQINAFSKKPGARIYYRGQIIKIITSEIATKKRLNAYTLSAIDKKLYLGTNDYAIEIFEIQPQGKGVIKGIDFINGYKINETIKLEEV